MYISIKSIFSKKISSSLFRKNKHFFINRVQLKNGFSLIELMVILLLIAILVSLAAPNFSEVYKNARLDAAANDLGNALNFARFEAVKRGISVGVQGAADGGFRKGWRVFVNNAYRDQVPADNDARIILATPSLHNQVIVVSNDNQAFIRRTDNTSDSIIYFDRNGKPYRFVDNIISPVSSAYFLRLTSNETKPKFSRCIHINEQGFVSVTKNIPAC